MAYLNNKDPLILRNIIMEHYERPKHKIDDDQAQRLTNYLQHHNKTTACIDDLTLYLKVEDQVIKEVYFAGTGCAIAIASTDIMCAALINCDLSVSLELINQYECMVKGLAYEEHLMGELIAFYNVKNQPNRYKCAMIGALTIKECLNKDGWE